MEKNQKLIWTIAITILFFLLLVSSVRADIFSIAPDSINKTVNSGEFGFITEINITNPNNFTLLLNATYGGTNLFIIPNSTSVNTNSSIIFPISYAIPQSLKPGKYNVSINFTSQNETKNVFVELDVKDSIPPILSNCILSARTQNRTKDIGLKCDATDNIEVTIIKFNITNETFPMQKDFRDTWIGRFKILDIGNYNITIFAFDSSGNQINLTLTTITITDFNPISIQDINFLHIKTGISQTRNLATIHESTRTSLLINNFKFDLHPNETIRMVLKQPDGLQRDVTGKIGEVINLDNLPQGIMSIEISSNTTGVFHGNITLFSADKEYVSRISGEFSYYTVPQDEHFIWFGKTVFCRWEDGGIKENSSQICIITSSDIDTPINSSSLPAPVELFRGLDPVQVGKLQEALKGAEAQLLIFKILFSAAAIILIVYFLYNDVFIFRT